MGLFVTIHDLTYTDRHRDVDPHQVVYHVMKQQATHMKATEREREKKNTIFKQLKSDMILSDVCE